MTYYTNSCKVIFTLRKYRKAVLKKWVVCNDWLDNLNTNQLKLLKGIPAAGLYASAGCDDLWEVPDCLPKQGQSGASLLQQAMCQCADRQTQPWEVWEEMQLLRNVLPRSVCKSFFQWESLRQMQQPVQEGRLLCLWIVQLRLVCQVLGLYMVNYLAN